jgi:hypothetical protein
VKKPSLLDDELPSGNEDLNTIEDNKKVKYVNSSI